MNLISENYNKYKYGIKNFFKIGYMIQVFIIIYNYSLFEYVVIN